jgi:hypothetical protein
LAQLIELAGVETTPPIYYGKNRPVGFDGIFIQESDFWEKYNTPGSLPENVIVKPEQVILYGAESAPDYVAGTFFMLTRYEELFVKERDEHGRFPASASVAYKYGFLERPIVDEYAELIFKGLPRKQREFEFILTHDVDKLAKGKWEAIKTELKNVLRLRLSGIPGIIYHLLNKKDPADTFDWLETLEKGQHRIYFFMNKSEDGHELQSERAQALIKKIKNSGARVGWHPNFLSSLAVSCPHPSAFGGHLPRSTGKAEELISRNHFLMFNAGNSWELLESLGVKQDYTIGYPDMLGFRAGTCQPYRIFSVAKGKVLNITEYPLTMMDVTLYGYMRLGPQEAWQEFIKYFETIKRYSGKFILLWHNFSFDEARWRKFYKNVVNYLNNNL